MGEIEEFLKDIRAAVGKVVGETQTTSSSVQAATLDDVILGGTGTAGYVPLWDGTSSLSNSSITDNGSIVTATTSLLKIAYNSTNHLAIAPGGTGTMTYTATGATPKHLFVNQVTVQNDTATNFQVRRTTDPTYGMGLAIASGGSVDLAFTNNGGSTGVVIRPAGAYSGQAILDVTNDVGTSRFKVMYDGSTTIANTLGVTGVATFTARDVHNGGITDLSTTATQFTHGYDSSNQAAWDTSSAGATLVTMNATSGTGHRLSLQPAGTAMTNGGGATTFRVLDFSGNQRFSVGRIGSTPNALGHCVRIGFDASNYMQISNGIAASANVTISNQHASGTNVQSIIFSPPLTLSAAVTHNGLDTFNAGATFQTVLPTSSIGFQYNTVAPFFNNVNPTFATTADGVFQGFEWPFTNPMTSKVRVGVQPALFNSRLDHSFFIGYNTNASGTRDNSSEHSFYKSTEFDYHYSATAGAEAVEDNWQFTTPGGNTWRPQQFYLDVAANSAEGLAEWTFQANNTANTAFLSNQGNWSLRMRWPWVSVNLEGNSGNGYDVYQDSGFSAFMRTGDFDPGTLQNTAKFQTISDANDANWTIGVRSDIDYSAAGVAMGGGFHNFDAFIPSDFGAASTVGDVSVYHAWDQRYDRAGYTGTANIIHINSQTCGSTGAKGNIYMAGTGYNHGHIVLGSTHMWEEAAGIYRGKGSAPSSDSDGYPILPFYANSRSAAQTAAVGSVAALTVGSADTSFEVSANVNVTTSTVHNFTVTCAYTDEGNTARTLTLGFTQLSGATLLTAITNVTGAGPYESPIYRLRCKAGSTVTIASTGTFTTVTYNIEGLIKQAS